MQSSCRQPVTEISPGGSQRHIGTRAPRRGWVDVHPQSPSPSSHSRLLKGLDVLDEFLKRHFLK